jgi:hypothetical protein
MDVSTGAAIVIIVGLAALAASFVLAVLLYRLDRRERGHGLAHPERREVSAIPQDERRPRAA